MLVILVEIEMKMSFQACFLARKSASENEKGGMMLSFHRFLEVIPLKCSAHFGVFSASFHSFFAYFSCF